MRIANDSQLRGTQLPTIPSTIAIEKATNPFLRTREPAIVASLAAAGRLGADADPVAVFAALREWKNVF
jgi:hydroxyacylglutathione hydrolase